MPTPTTPEHCDTCNMTIKRRARSAYPGCAKCGDPIVIGEHFRWERTAEGGKPAKRFHCGCFRAVYNPTPHDLPTPRVDDDDDAPTPTPTPSPTPTPTPGTLDAIGSLALALLPHLAALGLRGGVDEAQLAAAVERAVDAALRHHDAPRVVDLHVTTGTPPAPRHVGLTHHQLPQLIQLARAGVRCFYLYGAPGAGKSHAAEQLATALGGTFHGLSLERATLATALIGYQDAMGTLRKGPFILAVEAATADPDHLHVFDLEEADNSNASVLTTLNAALSAPYQILTPWGAYTMPRNLIVYATGNTSSRGAHPAFPERRPFDAAFRSRFRFVNWTYDLALERAVARAIADAHALPLVIADAWAAWVAAARTYCETHSLPVFASTRAITCGLPEFAAASPVAAVADAWVFQGTDDATRTRILDAVPLPTVTYTPAPTPTPAPAGEEG